MQDIKQKIEEWTKPPFNKDIIEEINKLVRAGNEKELTDRFYTNLEFGTGGLRGIIGAGTNRMNIYTVGMATQGLANYIKTKNKSGKGIVIARDSRRMSDTFALEAAAIFAGNGIQVYLFGDIMPTPVCSFAIRELGAVSGIVITASHNPPEYNGYKVYWEDGGQVTSPQDKEIIAEVNKIESPGKIIKTDYESAVKSGLIRIIGEEITGSYIKRLEGSALRPKSDSAIKIVYTPLHGTGYKIIPRVMDYFGFKNMLMVKEQTEPDGNFPTVKYPNPEEKEALELSLILAEKTGADIIMATDPDADRMGIGFKDGKGGYILINGNQIGVMLEYYLLSRLKEENRLPSNAAIIKTIVTTELQDEIAKGFGCRSEDVLTGFKWIAKKMKEYEDTGKSRFVFGGEESYGYLPVDFVRDKDAVSSCYFFAEMADWLANKSISLYDFLTEIYLKHKLYIEDLHSLTLKGIDGMEKIKKIMHEFRIKPPEDLAGYKTVRVADISALKMLDIKTGHEEKIEGLPPSDVLQFYLDEGSKVTVRPSGTEPKIKFYFSVNDKADKSNIEDKKINLKEKIDRIKKDMIAKAEGVK